MPSSKKNGKKVTTPSSKKTSAAPKPPVLPKGKPLAKPARPLAARKAVPAPAAPAAPAPAAPRKWPKGGPTKAEQKVYRNRLVEMRRALLSSSKELAQEALQSGGGEFSVDHMADHGSDNYEQDFNLKLLEGEAGQLENIRDALLKLDGRHELPFGLCEACADTPQGLCPTCPWIPSSRLEVLPHARLCVQTKETEEQRGR